MKLQLRHLVHAVALAEAGNYTVAARNLHLSQPALSRSIQVIEGILRARLFERVGGVIKPTPVGQIVVERGKLLLAGAEDVEREVQLALGLEVGSLKIGAGPYPADISVGIACGRLALKHPHVKLDVRVGDWQFLHQLVLEGKLDFAVAELAAVRNQARLEQEPLPRHQGHYFCRSGHPLARKKKVTLEDTRAFPLVTSSLPERFGKLMPTIRVDTFQLARDIVIASDALGLGAPSNISAELAEGLIVRLPPELPWLSTNYGFIWPKGRTLSPAAMALMDMIREVEAEIAQAKALNPVFHAAPA